MKISVTDGEIMLSKRPAKDISTAKNGVVHIFLSPSRLDTASSYLVVARACAWAPRRVRNRNSPLFFSPSRSRRPQLIENGAKLSSILSAYSQDVSEIFRQIISKSGIYLYLVLFIIENEANMFLFKYACMRTMYMHKIFFR
jgi:hypothetical protein